MTVRGEDRRGSSRASRAKRLAITVPLLGMSLIAVSWAKNAARSPEITWTMLQVNAGPAQADAHLLQMPGGEVFLVDAGDLTSGVPDLLRRRGIRRVDKVIISHPHKDHYAGLLPLLEEGVEVGALYMNAPLREVCDQERPWGCDFEHVQKTMQRYRTRGIPVRALHAGDVLYDRGESRLEVLYAYDGVATPIGKTDVNDTSVILLLTQGRTRALFTGDLNRPMGAYLARAGRRLEAEILKVPHHGAEGVVPNEFFDRVAPRLALAPAPPALWQSDRTRRVREHLKTMGVETLVSGLNGEVEVRLRSSDYVVGVERRTPNLRASSR